MGQALGVWPGSCAPRWKGTLGMSLLGWGKPGFRSAPLPTDPRPRFPVQAHVWLVSMLQLPLLASPALSSRIFTLILGSYQALFAPGSALDLSGVSQGPSHSARGRVGGMEPWQPEPRGPLSWPGATAGRPGSHFGSRHLHLQNESLAHPLHLRGRLP